MTHGPCWRGVALGLSGSGRVGRVTGLVQHACEAHLGSVCSWPCCGSSASRMPHSAQRPGQSSRHTGASGGSNDGVAHLGFEVEQAFTRDHRQQIIVLALLGRPRVQLRHRRLALFGQRLEAAAALPTAR